MRLSWYVQETSSKQFVVFKGRGFIDRLVSDTENATEISTERFARFCAKDLTVAQTKGNGKVYEAISVEWYDEREMG